MEIVRLIIFLDQATFQPNHQVITLGLPRLQPRYPLEKSVLLFWAAMEELAPTAAGLYTEALLPIPGQRATASCWSETSMAVQQVILFYRTIS